MARVSSRNPLMARWRTSHRTTACLAENLHDTRELPDVARRLTFAEPQRAPNRPGNHRLRPGTYVTIINATIIAM